MYHGMIQQLSQTGNKLSICLISLVEWEDYCRMQMIQAFDKHRYRVIPRPSQLPEFLMNVIVLIQDWPLSIDPSEPLEDWELNCPQGQRRQAFNDLCSYQGKLLYYSVDNYNYNTTLLCVLQICGTFCFPRPRNFWIFNEPRGIELCSGLLTCTKLEFAEVQCEI